ncbi:MAG: tRNA 2-thiouridine(34) synthase MnmA [Pseudomonadota bacterium]
MTETIAIALSGGVDSMTAAYLLKKEGHSVFGIHFLTGFEASTGFNREEQDAPEIPKPGSRERLPLSAHPVRQVARQLNIPIHILDIRSEFKRHVVDYFVQEYRSGKTPNPCLVCNPSIKFGAVLSFAQTLGASRLATGHYAKLEMDEANRCRLLKGADPDKDQSYFLARLTQNQLRMASFPLGDYFKADVKALAKKVGLIPGVGHESQDICFIREKTYGEFILSEGKISPEGGWIEDTGGKRLGRHNGLHRFTIGQRKGINCPAARPYYVVRLDTLENKLIVGSGDDLLSASCRVERINWIAEAPTAPITALIRIRYRHTAVPSTVIPIGRETAVVEFKEPQKAVTPGQGAVFYKGKEVLGGGWIASEKP